MQGEELKTPILTNAVLDMQTEGEQESAFIVRYNQVITVFNRYAEEGTPKMEVMVGNRFIKKVSECLGSPVSIVVLLLVMLLVPILNIFCLACIFSYLLYLRR